jgi:hypothetical protein
MQGEVTVLRVDMESLIPTYLPEENNRYLCRFLEELKPDLE